MKYLIHALTFILVFLPIVFYFTPITSQYPDIIFIGVGVIAAILAVLAAIELLKRRMLGKNMLYLVAGMVIILIPVAYLSFQETEYCIFMGCSSIGLYFFTVPYIFIFLAGALTTTFYLRNTQIMRALSWKQIFIPSILAFLSLALCFTYFLSVLR